MLLKCEKLENEVKRILTAESRAASAFKANHNTEDQLRGEEPLLLPNKPDRDGEETQRQRTTFIVEESRRDSGTQMILNYYRQIDQDLSERIAIKGNLRKTVP